ncbi:MAG: hypothetical protein KME40_23650 [Komarekiella atlantica HA4396-MV6]|nr:hypothetical protein [Komarekiella atlantica HA4396-MV6]
MVAKDKRSHSNISQARSTITLPLKLKNLAIITGFELRYVACLIITTAVH